MNFLFLLLPTLIYSFHNLPVHLYSNNIKNLNNVKVIEPINIENKKNIPAFVFFSGLSGKIPHEIYNNFLNYVASSGISCHIFNDDIYKSNDLIEYLNLNYANITISGHSSGGSKALQLYSISNYVNNLILFDPVDDRMLYNNKYQFLYNTFFDKSKNEIEINNIKNYLLVKAENSYKWNMFPTKIPFIPLFDINEKIVNIENECYILNDIIDEIINENDEVFKITKTISKKINSNKKSILIKNFGHTDLLDEYWSKIMRKVLKENNKDKTFDNLNEYHKFNAFLVNQVCYNNLSNLKQSLKIQNELTNIQFSINDI